MNDSKCIWSQSLINDTLGARQKEYYVKYVKLLLLSLLLLLLLLLLSLSLSLSLLLLLLLLMYQVKQSKCSINVLRIADNQC